MFASLLPTTGPRVVEKRWFDATDVDEEMIERQEAQIGEILARYEPNRFVTNKPPLTIYISKKIRNYSMSIVSATEEIKW
jgi:hypothetical protein